MKLYKFKNRIICHITEFNGIFSVKTGKPSDPTCISWQYTTKEEAEKTAQEYFQNYTSPFSK